MREAHVCILDFLARDRRKHVLYYNVFVLGLPFVVYTLLFAAREVIDVRAQMSSSACQRFVQKTKFLREKMEQRKSRYCNGLKLLGATRL